MAEQTVTCVRECFYSKRKRHYTPGDQDKIDPREPVAQYFTGWAPGTEVYHKVRGSKDKEVKETTKIIPGATPVMVEGGPEPAAPAAPATAPAPVEGGAADNEFPCDLCDGAYIGKSAASLAAHKIHCAKKQAAQLPE